MGKKVINPGQINGTSGKVRDTIIPTESAVEGWIEDTSMETLIKTDSAMKAGAINIEDAASNLNDYLDKVADAFVQADDSLSQSIGSRVFRGMTSSERYYRSKYEKLAKEMP